MTARARVTWAVILTLGALARAVYVARPFDHRIRTSWRQSDYVQIARNFDREGMNILYPRIDWRGDTPGYVEAELPIVPWLGACLYRVFGMDERLLRIIPCAFSVATLFLFAWLAARILPMGGAQFATAAFALNPILIYLSTAIQPESVMLFFSVAAFAAIVAWQREQSLPRLLVASVLVGAAILAKTPAAALGLVLAFAVFRSQGVRCLADWRVHLAGWVGILPPLGWYAWTHRFWTQYGNSLGISNESHFIGVDILFPPTFLLGNFKWESIVAVSPAGWLLILAALGTSLGRAGLAWGWYGAVWVFYMLAARTSGDNWAYYYHCSSVPPACLLLGVGVSGLWAGLPILRNRLALKHQRAVGLALMAGTLLGFVAVTSYLLRLRDNNPELLALRTCALALAEYVPSDGLIVVKGGRMFDELGRRVAYNEPMVFAWMDRKGFNYGLEEFSLETLERIRGRGGRYWLAERSEVERAGLAEEVARRYRRIADCEGKFQLYDLATPPEGPQG
ncbi:MAG: hypothetical protein GHCLOJNM_02564 [bacterium]|nr:hypothetical protein [bacterium]